MAKMEGRNRWWEFYAVRYAMGTLTGAAVVFAISIQLGFASPKLETVGPYEALAYMAIGLVYCYVASGPILVFHAARFSVIRLAHKRSKPSLILSVFALGALAFGAFMAVYTSHVWLFLAAAFCAAQYICALILIIDNKRIHEGYQLIASARASSRAEKQIDDTQGHTKEMTTGNEMVESYRHLREHGNSFFILFLELVVAGAAITLIGPDAAKIDLSNTDLIHTLAAHEELIVALVLWILPPMVVWSLSLVIEYRFGQHPPKAAKQNG